MDSTKINIDSQLHLHNKCRFKLNITNRIYKNPPILLIGYNFLNYGIVYDIMNTK